MDRISITITNWEKYNPRKDLKNPTWFRMSNDLIDHPDFVDFSPLEFHALVYFLSLASRRNSATIEINYAHAKIRNIQNATIISTIQKLQRNQTVQISEQICTDDFDLSCTTNERTNDTNTSLCDARPAAPSSFDFEILYKGWPRKIGKAKGMARLVAMVRDQKTYDLFAKAVRNYAQVTNGRDDEHKLHWSSFVGTKAAPLWRDYVDVKTSQSRSGIVER